jgi:hypothetical protein
MKKVTGREGHCYELAWHHINDMMEGTLIHCTVYSFALQKRIDHALIETESGDVIWEPVSDRYLVKKDLYELYQVIEIKRYTYEEVCINTLKHETFGPWED